MEDNYESFKSEYLRLSDIDLNSYKESQMKRRINNFMSKYEVKDYSGFLQLLKKDTEVYDKFITYLTINVSEFYRNPLQWQALEKEVFPSMLERYKNRPIKIGRAHV